jgi:hypothetical protein
MWLNQIDLAQEINKLDNYDKHKQKPCSEYVHFKKPGAWIKEQCL